MSDLDFTLPPERVATRPAEPRDHSRLMVIQNKNPPSHRHFHDIPEFLRLGDLLVVNDTRVLPAKLILRRKTGAAISGLFLSEPTPGIWRVMLRTRGKVADSEELIGGDYHFLLHRRLGEGIWEVRVRGPVPLPSVDHILAAIGQVPLPPYIEKQRKALGTSIATPADTLWYQTVYAQNANTGTSVAAPTAGLHFTAELLTKLQSLGISRVAVELQVGMGTFLPVETETLEEHKMHTESYHIPAPTIAALRSARRDNRRIIVVGTTAVRTLESAAEKILDTSHPPTDISGNTNLKISPGFRFRLTDALVTNFHLPKSTLMALVAAFLGDNGVDRLKSLYTQAIQHEYRFYSYGDAMLILP